MMADLTGKTCIVTGGSTGIGHEIALGLAQLGAQVVVVCRNRARGEASVARIRARTGSEAVDLMLCDLSAQASVRRLARDILHRHAEIHVLVNNAGVYRRRRELSEDGFESTLATNHLGPFLLTNLLLERILASAPARVVNLTSDLHRRARLDLDDLNLERGFRGMKAYARSKLANVVFSLELARRVAGRGIEVNAVHPGGVATELGQGDGGLVAAFFRLGRPVLLTPAQGADTPLFLAVSEEVKGVSGRYFIRRRLVDPARHARSPALGRRFWEVSEKLVHLGDDAPLLAPAAPRGSAAEPG
jgi:NAD(P)-dependent dehydrogenase (short-subunit alcohol dehydrogenase family)